MLYIQQSLTDGEELVHVAYFHWMYSIQAIFNVVFGFLMAIGVIFAALYLEPMLFGVPDAESGISWLERVRGLHAGVKIVAFFMIVLGLLRFTRMMVDKATTEIAITNKRLVYKRGLVARYVGEMNIDRIEGVNVLQGVLGRIFGYGSLMIRGMGIGEVILPPIADPIKFRRAIEKARNV